MDLDDDLSGFEGTSNAALDDRSGPDEVVESPPNDLREALLFEHPDYVANKEKWNKYIDCYESEDMKKFLHKHTRESTDTFDKRIGRGYFYNYVASIVDLFVSYIFHAPISRETDSEVFNELYEDADLQGTDYLTFMQVSSSYAQVCGFVGLLIDAPKPDPNILSEADRKAAKARPYMTRVLPTQILDWELDDFGNFMWVKIEVYRPQDRTFQSGFDNTARNFLIWTRTSWTEYKVTDEEALTVDGGDHSLGIVPLVILRNEPKQRHPWFGQSAVRDIADINIAIMNWCSLGDEEIFERCLNVLAIEGDGNQTVQLSHGNVLGYPAGSANPPEYLTPGESPLELIGKWIDRAIDQMYRLAKLGGSTGLLGVREATSGIAYAYEFNETNQSLGNKAKFINQAELEIHWLFSRWMGKEFEGKIEYPKEFGVDDFLLELETILKGKSTISSETAQKTLEKNVLNKMFALETPELREKISKEVDAAKFIPPGSELDKGPGEKKEV